MSVSDDDLRKRLQEVLKTADLETTTEKQLRLQLEEEFGCELKPQKAIFKEEILKYLEAQQGADADQDAEDIPATKKRKSVEDDDVAFEISRPRAAKKVKAAPKPRAKKEKDPNAKPSGFAKPQKISPEFEAVVGVAAISRGEAMKKLWEYIKSHELQDQADKRKILVKKDPKLHALLKVDKCDGFAMTKHLKNHFLGPADSPTEGNDSNDE